MKHTSQFEGTGAAGDSWRGDVLSISGCVGQLIAETDGNKGFWCEYTNLTQACFLLHSYLRWRAAFSCGLQRWWCPVPSGPGLLESGRSGGRSGIKNKFISHGYYHNKDTFKSPHWRDVLWQARSLTFPVFTYRIQCGELSSHSKLVGMQTGRCLGTLYQVHYPRLACLHAKVQLLITMPLVMQAFGHKHKKVHFVRVAFPTRRFGIVGLVGLRPKASVFGMLRMRLKNPPPYKVMFDDNDLCEMKFKGSLKSLEFLSSRVQECLEQRLQQFCQKL